jgi:hypothetical protein
MTAARTGHGATVTIDAGGGATAIAGIIDIVGPELAVEQVDGTSLDSTDGYTESVPALKTGGTVTLTVQFTNDMQQQAIRNLIGAVTPAAFVITLPTSPVSVISFAGVVSSWVQSTEADVLMPVDIDITLTGAPVFGDAPPEPPAVTEPQVYTMAATGDLGRETLNGDFPAGWTISSGVTATAAGHGTNGTSDSPSYLYLPIDVALAAAVDYAELRINVAAWPNSPNLPQFNVAAVKAATPAHPSSGASAWPSATRTAPGWTTAAVTWTPESGETGEHRIDVTDIINELIASTGTGTAVCFTLETVQAASTARGMTLAAFGTYAPSLRVYRDLEARSWQEASMDGMQAIFFCAPFDSELGATEGAQATTMPIVHAGVTDLMPMTGVDQHYIDSKLYPGRHAWRFDYETTELGVDSPGMTAGRNGRRFFAPDQGADHPSIGANFYWPIHTRDTSYCMLIQTKFDTGDAGAGFIYDLRDDDGVVFNPVDPIDGQPCELGMSSGRTTLPTFAIAGRTVAGEAHLTALYYDAATNLGYAGHFNGQAWDWTSGTTVAGMAAIAPAQPVSGYLLNKYAYIQALGAFEITSPKHLSRIKAALKRAQKLWDNGIKSVPPAFLP